MKSSRMFILAALLALVSGAQPLSGQDLVAMALSSFPADTIRLEFSNPATLRKLPNYASLREHYLGPRLKELEDSMAELGVAETDIDQLVLGWNSDGSDLNLYGFAGGNFRSSILDARAAERNLPPQEIGGKTGYCLGAGLASQCVVVLSPTEGAFGTLATLSQITQALNGGGDSIGSNGSFARAVKQEQTGAPIWGVAVASAVASWFKGWMPRQSAIDMDWNKVFQGVDALGYKIQTGSDIQLDLAMFCKSDEYAGSLRQVLEGLKLAQQIAWQNQYPSKSNPFQRMDLSQSGSQIGINVVANYGDIGGNAPSASQ
ncbi:MAG: hypothetical protein EPN47_01035 [Acidobacteria bacterium]|nr:MAG: hypothetical protein EPN47_01035 [Acidobacteriota bacterium]